MITEKKILSEEKIPMPPIKQEYYLPVKFLTNLLATLDYKIEILAKTVGYGFVTLRISVYKGRVANVHFNDEISMKQLVNQYFPEVTNEEKVDIR